MANEFRQLFENADAKIAAVTELVGVHPFKLDSPFLEKAQRDSLLGEAREIIIDKRKRLALERLVGALEDLAKIEAGREEKKKAFTKEMAELDKQLDLRAKELERLGYEVDTVLKKGKGGQEKPEIQEAENE